MLPIGELASVVISERAVSVSAAALAELAAANVAMTVCDEKYRPVGMMQPLAATSVCDLFRRQVEMREPLRKQWGFEPFQESVYVKECDTEWHMKMVSRMVGGIVPAEGKVATCSFSDRQWAETMQYEDGEKIEERDEPRQMVMML